MDEQTISSEERLKQLDSERKGLRVQIKDERTLRLEEAAKMRERRDIKIEEIQKKLTRISEKIYSYNKLGKVAKMECDILKIIAEEIESEWKSDSDPATQTSTGN